ncbi:MAG: hypothetical protein OCC45_08730 [Desulfotalea sp.]
MIWIYRNTTEGFEDLALAEILSAGLTQASNRFFYGETFDLEKSAYARFSIREVSRGSSPEEVIKNFSENIPSPYRLEKIHKNKRRGSKSYAFLAEKFHGGEIRASNPKSIVLVFSPDNVLWVAGFVREKTNSILDKLQHITERTCVSLKPHAALALINISGSSPVIDPCCGTGLLPLAAKLLDRESYASDNNVNMLRKAKTNRDVLGVDLDIHNKDAFTPWLHDCCLVCDFPADRSWCTSAQDLSLAIFTKWIPFIKTFCIIIPDRIVGKLPNTITVNKKIKFTAGRTIVVGEVIKS